MISLENYRSPKFVDYCTEELTAYSKSYRGIEAALVATPDGFEVASYANVQNYSADKLAAVGSSLFALGSSLVSEFKLQNCKSVILDSDSGKVYISSIRAEKYAVVLMVQTTEQATLGNIIHGAKKLHEKIASQLSTIG